MRDTIRTFVAEFIGTFALTFVGGAAIMATRGAEAGSGLLIAAMAHGLILGLMITALMKVSAAFNPAVSFALVLTRTISPVTFAVHLVAQLAGAVVAAMLLQGNMPPEAVTATRIGGQQISTLITGPQAVFLEATATFLLVMSVFGTAVDPKGPKVGGFAIGLTVAADILAIGGLTGASMNPARTFGPAFVSGIWEGHAIYWIGPLVGAAVAGLLYKFLFLDAETA
ncbi:MAG: aquaporin [Gemmatimonadetes bacterium]|nr:aquaporin [Gemmatimonadota bacterium]